MGLHSIALVVASVLPAYGSDSVASQDVGRAVLLGTEGTTLVIPSNVQPQVGSIEGGKKVRLTLPGVTLEAPRLRIEYRGTVFEITAQEGRGYFMKVVRQSTP